MATARLENELLAFTGSFGSVIRCARISEGSDEAKRPQVCTTFNPAETFRLVAALDIACVFCRQLVMLWRC